MRVHLASWTVFYVLGASTAWDAHSPNSCLFGGDWALEDLTHPFSEDSIYWPNSRRFQLTEVELGERADGSWYAAKDFCAGEHGGTHMDAPYHFSEGGMKAGDITLEKLILPMYVVDISSQVRDDPAFVLEKRHLDHMLNVFDASAPALVLFKFGWSKFYGNQQRYLGLRANKTLNFPGLSGELASWIVSSYKNVVGVGVDTASVDPGSSQDFLAHKILLGAGLYVLENVKMDTQLSDIKCTALVMPMKIKYGTGAPLRLAAICPRQHQTVFTARDQL